MCDLDVSSDSSMLSFATSDVETDPELIAAEATLEEEQSHIRHSQGCKVIKESIQKSFEQFDKTGIPPAMIDNSIHVLSVKVIKVLF